MSTITLSYAKKMSPYTMDEINAMIDRLDEESAVGEFRSN